MYRPVFVLGVRVDDRPIIEEIARRTGIGSVYFRPIRGSRRPNPYVSWQLNTKTDALALVDLLEIYPLRAKKRREFEIWARAVRCHALKRHHGNDWSDLAALREELRHARTVGLSTPLGMAA